MTVTKRITTDPEYSIMECTSSHLSIFAGVLDVVNPNDDFFKVDFSGEGITSPFMIILIVIVLGIPVALYFFLRKRIM